MRRKVKYTDPPPDIAAELEGAVQILDFLPPPSELVRKREKRKVTIALDSSIVDFFKLHAKENGVKYQTMINNLLREYVNQKSRKI